MADKLKLEFFTGAAPERCNVCGSNDLVRVTSKRNGKEYVRYICKPCRNKYQRKRVKKHRDYYNSIKLTHGCAICGYSKCAPALHPHHVNMDGHLNSRKYNGLTMTPVQFALLSSLRKVKEEMVKTVILCCNCHYELHAGMLTKKMMNILEKKTVRLPGQQLKLFD